MINRQLAYPIMELREIVNTARDNFSKLDTVLKSLSANQLINDPAKWGTYEFKTYTGAFIANIYLNPPR